MSHIDNNAMNKLTYGLFVLTAPAGDKFNGCIINTASQVTTDPKRITIAVNKANYTHDLVLNSGIANVTILDESAQFSLFTRFGFSSGRDTDKFAGFDNYATAENGVPYITESAAAMMSVKVVNTMDLGTHTLFLCDVTEAKVLSGARSVTYQYYFDHIKPARKPAPVAEKEKWVCKICGYEHEGPLPADFICPICKHPAEDFEKVAPAAEPAPKKEKWVCKICGYEHEGPLPADFICPICKHPAEDFERA